MQKFIIFKILQIVIFIESVENANILAIFPLPVKSHFVMTKAILGELAAKGHKIDLYTTFSEGKQIPGINHTQIPGFPPYTEAIHSVSDLRKLSPSGILSMMFQGPDPELDFCGKVFRSDVSKKLIDSKKQYDLFLVEMFAFDCFFGYAHVFKTPVVALTSSVDLPWGSYRIGNIDNPTYIPTYFMEFGEKMTLYERFLNTLNLIYTKYKHQSYLAQQQEVAKKFFGSDFPCLDDIVSNTSLFLVNSHFSSNLARPTVPNFIEVAGLHIGEPKPVTKDISNKIGHSKFIYFSFGSIANSGTIPLEKLQYICDTFKKLKYNVLWKVDRKQLPKELIIPENVYTKSWMPQLDILCHPNILFFISHSGLMGTQEAIYCGVPILSVPLYADQFQNAKNNENKGIALRLNIDTASREEIYSLMKELIDNPKYMENAKKISEHFKDRPRTPRAEAAYWIEYVLRHKGAPQLRSRSADLAWYQYYLVDVGLIVLSLVTIILIVIYKITKLILKFVLRNKLAKNKKRQ